MFTHVLFLNEKKRRRRKPILTTKILAIINDKSQMYNVQKVYINIHMKCVITDTLRGCTVKPTPPIINDVGGKSVFFSLSLQKG